MNRKFFFGVVIFFTVVVFFFFTFGFARAARAVGMGVVTDVAVANRVLDAVNVGGDVRGLVGRHVPEVGQQVVVDVVQVS